MGEVLAVTDRDARSAYLDLLRRDLTRYGVHELPPRKTIGCRPRRGEIPDKRCPIERFNQLCLMEEEENAADNQRIRA
jgi:hypothetical protein